MILKQLSKIKRSPRMERIRKYTNLLYYDPETVVMRLEDFDHLSIDGYKFKASDQLNAIQRIEGNPWFEGIRETDVVLDIGANIGAMAIPFASKGKFLYAVEPLFFGELKENIELNNLTEKVKIIGMAVSSSSKELEIKFSSKHKIVNCVSFNTIKQKILLEQDRIDFLKMDGEGCEWEMNPEELEGIRELRIEFHIRRGRERECKEKYNRYIQWMYTNGYKVYIDHPNYGPDPYDKEDYMVRASKGG